MSEKIFAFESGKVSIAFPVFSALGDCVIMKKILSALVELSPDCLIDTFYSDENHKNFIKAFYSDVANLNLIVPINEHYQNVVRNYDLLINVIGTYGVFFNCFNPQKLQNMAPSLFQAVKKIDEYNKINVQNFGSLRAVALRNFAMSKVLNKNCYEILSCDGALPIHDDKVKILLAPEYKPQFDALKLGKYITIYSDIERDITPPKAKTWPLQHLREYVRMLKQRVPDVEIVQCGGVGDIKIENVDRHFLGCELELTKYILANSLLHVGCEGGLIHLATALGTKCLVLFGLTSVCFYGYNQNINIASEVCYPCAEVWDDCLTRECGRGAKEPPCMLSITPKQVFEVTCNYLKHLGLKNNA